MIALWISQIAQPDPVAQPAPAWLLWGLLLLTFFLHVLPMNFVLGGSTIALVARWRSRRPGATHEAALAAWLARAMPVAVAATVTFGVAPLLFLQALYGRVFFSSSVLMAGIWLAVVPLLILAYYGTYLLAYKGRDLGRAALAVSGLIAVLVLAIAVIYTTNMSLMLHPERFLELYRADARGLHLNLADPTWPPRFLHIVLAALAVAGTAVTLYGWYSRARDEAFGVWAMRHGASWCAAATGLSVIAGFWWLLALPGQTLQHVMSRPAAMALFLGVTTGLVVLSLAVLASRAADPRPHARWLTLGLVLTLVLMLLTRDQIRTISLADAGFMPTAWVAPQWGAIAMFVVLLVAAVAAVVWMVMALARAGATAAR